MRPAVHAPHSPANLGIKFHPIGGVRPFRGHAFCRTEPGFATVFAAEKADVGRGDELAIMIEGIEVVAVGSGDVESGGSPAFFSVAIGINSDPCCATVGGSHRAPEVGAVGEIGILIGDSEVERIFSPVGTKALSDPGVVNVCGPALQFC